MGILDILLNHQLLAVLVEIFYILLCHFFIAYHLEKLNYGEFGALRLSLFVVILTAIVLIPNYLVLFGWQMVFSPEALPAVRTWSKFFLQYRNPIWLIVYMLLARHLLKLSKQYVAGSALTVFCFVQIFTLASDAMEYVFLLLRDVLQTYTGYNLLHILLIVVTIVINLYFAYYIRKNAHKFKWIFEAGYEKSRWIGLINVIAAAFIWLALASIYLFFQSQHSVLLAVEQFFYPFMILFLTAIFIQSLRISMLNAQMSGMALNNNLLFKDIDDFKGMRHDLNNILQVYDGYIKTQQYEDLQAFHEELFDTMTQINDSLNLHIYLKDSPALYGLFMGAQRKAEEMGVDLQIKDVQYFQYIDLPILDLCRVLSNLLDNAIEHATDSEPRQVIVTLNNVARGRQEAIVSISNTTSEVVDIARIFVSGYTTKSGHMGQGLVEVNKILSRHYGCTITSSYDGGVFAMYLRTPFAVKRFKKTAP